MEYLKAYLCKGVYKVYVKGYRELIQKSTSYDLFNLGDT